MKRFLFEDHRGISTSMRTANYPIDHYVVQAKFCLREIFDSVPSATFDPYNNEYLMNTSRMRWISVHTWGLGNIEELWSNSANFSWVGPTLGRFGQSMASFAKIMSNSSIISESDNPRMDVNHSLIEPGELLAVAAWWFSIVDHHWLRWLIASQS